MCGISLLICNTSSATGAAFTGEAAIHFMQQAQQHRGPDSGQTVVLPWQKGTVFLGSRRLQILDSSEAADQPLQRQWQHKRGWLSYNGELYNYTDLRNELLQLGCAFSSSSDTEVVLYALLVWGKKALPRFNSMFALAYYEAVEGHLPRLLLARDRWGQKPLYLAQQQDVWMAASELQALFASGLVKKELNKPQVLHYLRYKYAARPETFFKGIQELEPGHSLEFTPGSTAVVATYATTELAVLERAPADAEVLDRVEELLIDALIGQLQSDKPVGLFLSGGLDSTLMLALLRRHAAWLLPICFTTGTSAAAGWGTKDMEWASKAAIQYEAYHQLLPVTAGGVVERFTELAQRQDQPIADSAWLLTCLLSEFATKQVKVVLSGAGADELLGGYHRHSAFAWYLKYQQPLQAALPLIKQSSKLLPTALALPGRARWQLAKKFARNLTTTPYHTFLNFTSLAILEKEEGQEALVQPQNWLQWALVQDRQQYLISDVLALNDKASMQFGLEMRMPYLDVALSEYLAQLPADYLLRDGKKWIVKQLLERYGGKAYTQRRKEGFGLPFGRWVQEGKTEELWKWVDAKAHPLHELLPPVVTQEMLQAQKKGRADYSQELMALALLAIWLEKNFS